jgi:hypothetical protein
MFWKTLRHFLLNLDGLSWAQARERIRQEEAQRPRFVGTISRKSWDKAWADPGVQERVARVRERMKQDASKAH